MRAPQGPGTPPPEGSSEQPGPWPPRRTALRFSIQYLPHGGWPACRGALCGGWGTLHPTRHGLAPVQPFAHGEQSRAGAQRAESGRELASESDPLQQLAQDSAKQVSSSRTDTYSLSTDVHAEMQEMRTSILAAWTRRSAAWTQRCRRCAPASIVPLCHVCSAAGTQPCVHAVRVSHRS